MCLRRRQIFFSPWILFCGERTKAVLTGTVLSGSCKVGDFVEIPHEKKKRR